MKSIYVSRSSSRQNIQAIPAAEQPIDLSHHERTSIACTYVGMIDIPMMDGGFLFPLKAKSEQVYEYGIPLASLHHLTIKGPTRIRNETLDE